MLRYVPWITWRHTSLLLLQRVRVSCICDDIFDLMPFDTALRPIKLLLSATDAISWSRSLALHPKPDNLTWLNAIVRQRHENHTAEHTTHTQRKILNKLTLSICYRVNVVVVDSILEEKNTLYID